MKRLRTISVRDPDALAAWLHKSGWGSAYWVNRNRAREREKNRVIFERFVKPMLRAQEAMMDTLPGERVHQEPSVH